jgi:hypothetical protein
VVAASGSLPRHSEEVSGQLHASVALPPGNSRRYSLNRKLGGPQSLDGAEEGNPLHAGN